jgi:hypothetical protein
VSNDKLAATTHGAECIRAIDEWRLSSGFLVSPSEYADWTTRAAMTDRALDLDKRQLWATGLGYVGIMATAANLTSAGLSLAAGHEFWPPLLVALFLALVTGGIFFFRRVWRLELRVIRTHLKAYYRRKRDTRIHRFENGHVAIIQPGAITINPDAGPITDRAVRQMAERAIREIQERGL